MYCVRNVTEDLFWVGGNDHRLELFENIHPIPRGVSYNSYLMMDEKTALFDTVDWSIMAQRFRLYPRQIRQMESLRTGRKGCSDCLCFYVRQYRICGTIPCQQIM